MSELRRISTGLPSLDRALGGGLVLGATYIITGPPGCGKTSLAILFADALSREVEVLYAHTTRALPPVGAQQFTAVSSVDVEAIVESARRSWTGALVVDSVAELTRVPNRYFAADTLARWQGTSLLSFRPTLILVYGDEASVDMRRVYAADVAIQIIVAPSSFAGPGGWRDVQINKNRYGVEGAVAHLRLARGAWRQEEEEGASVEAAARYMEHLRVDHQVAKDGEAVGAALEEMEAFMGDSRTWTKEEIDEQIGAAIDKYIKPIADSLRKLGESARAVPGPESLLTENLRALIEREQSAREELARRDEHHAKLWALALRQVDLLLPVLMSKLLGKDAKTPDGVAEFDLLSKFLLALTPEQFMAVGAIIPEDIRARFMSIYNGSVAGQLVPMVAHKLIDSIDTTAIAQIHVALGPSTEVASHAERFGDDCGKCGAKGRAPCTEPSPQQTLWLKLVALRSA